LLTAFWGDFLTCHNLDEKRNPVCQYITLVRWDIVYTCIRNLHDKNDQWHTISWRTYNCNLVYVVLLSMLWTTISKSVVMFCYNSNTILSVCSAFLFIHISREHTHRITPVTISSNRLTHRRSCK